MVITASWCIQIKPSERPSMSKVLEMFETDVTLLQMPPRPFQLPFEPKIDHMALQLQGHLSFLLLQGI
ncbi:hypothetical protein ES288_D11G356600v1 [Gossypium darwinii]|uniref:Serine-threonine/tyrosine-protein kinase catalytic domain-containing protein n=1 Tax=Gossypium darwinii TaxID=34276 RepID=A0A5D2AUL2_GOSDA|nr:hypothetical protein ES288_D11G356600v1 [Gossypium darwinii]